jgi:hypothetical protein
MIDLDQRQRTKLVISTFGVALAITFCGLFFIEGAGAPFVAVLGFPVFPSSLWRSVPIVARSVSPSALPFVGWIVYFGLGFVTVKARNRRTQAVSFAVFVLLSFANVVACWYGVNSPHYE